MSLGKVPVKAGGGAKRNASIEQGTQVSTATQRAATTTRHRHTEKLSRDNYQPVYLQSPAKREGQTAALMHKYEVNIAPPQSKHASSNAKRTPICWIGAHDPRTPLTSIGSILT